MRKITTVVVGAVLGLGVAGSTRLCPEARAAEPTGPFKADWDSLKKHDPAPEWFQDAKFGIYFHWGVYCVPAFGSEWYPRNMHIKDRPEYKHHVAEYGDPSKFGYHDFVPMFKAEKFNADEWAALFNKAGARFAGPVAEHHDGFAMWASKLTPWNAKDMGPKRDVTGELAEAVRKWGMRFVTTFHHARNNQHQIVQNGKKVWTGHYPRVEGWPTVSEDPKLRMLYGNLPREQFLEMWKGKLCEVIDEYRPDIIWFDSWLDEIPAKYQTEFLAYYFNRAHEWGKEVVVTVKQRDLPHEIAVEDFEKGRADHLTKYVWLTDDTVSRGSWCYTKQLRIKSADEVLDTLIDIISKNGILLLNISPMADGTIPDDQRNVLLALGEWLGKFGEAVYGTRPWLVFGEGPTRLEKGGHFVRMKGGYKPEDIRFTRKGGTIYAIALGWPGEKKQIVIKSFGKAKIQGDLKVTKVSMLGSPEAIPWEHRDEGLIVTTPGTKVDDMAVVFKIETTGSAKLR
ncbi:MAG: alpha-L-fucosidase [Phycisphaerae bacterium]|nr:alpha-L-fucosidase [Phycisphaerae bacterium]